MGEYFRCAKQFLLCLNLIGIFPLVRQIDRKVRDAQVQTDFISKKKDAASQTSIKSAAQKDAKEKLMRETESETSESKKQQNENVFHPMVRRERKPITYGK